MQQDWRSEINRILILLGMAAFLGWLFNHLLLFLLLAAWGYIGFSLVQMRRLNKWLRELTRDLDAQPPYSTGFWDALFDGFYRLHRGERMANRELQQILARAQASVSALDIGVILIDGENSLEWWNVAAGALLGIRYPQDQGQPITNLLRDPGFISYLEQKAFQEPLALASPVNASLVLEFQLTQLGEREKIMIVRDITRLHKLELTRKDFVANVSHELRTPLTVIGGYLENLSENRQALDPKWHKALEQMQQQARRMENIVTDLLLLSQLETKPASQQLTSVDVHKLLEDVSHDLRNIFADKRHQVIVDCPGGLSLTGSRDELYSAISNLAVNAAKYTPPGGTIELVGQRSGNQLEISVVDNGIGIDPQHIPRLTERFYRVDAGRSSGNGGTGLGLAIVKHILVRHDGSLSIRSKPGQGSRFVCRFPQSRIAGPKADRDPDIDGRPGISSQARRA